MKIIILDGHAENPGDLSWSGFEALGDLTVLPRIPGNDPKEIQKAIGDSEIVITNKTPITKETIIACPSIKYIGVLATGFNVVDTEAAKEKGIPVTNIPAYGTEAVSQYVFALLLEICSRVAHHDQAVKEGRWTECIDFCFWDYPLIEVANKTMGIIGLGRIGKTTAKIASAMGMSVIAYNPSQDEEGRKLAKYVTLDELLEKSDIVVLHCPLTPDTKNIINKETISKMKDGVILINNARGPLIVDKDLSDALVSGKVRAAGLDVISEEPICQDNPLLEAPNCFITPHISWAPIESRQRLMDIAVSNVAAFLNKNPVNVVNL